MNKYKITLEDIDGQWEPLADASETEIKNFYGNIIAGIMFYNYDN